MRSGEKRSDPRDSAPVLLSDALVREIFFQIPSMSVMSFLDLRSYKGRISYLPANPKKTIQESPIALQNGIEMTDVGVIN